MVWRGPRREGPRRLFRHRYSPHIPHPTPYPNTLHNCQMPGPVSYPRHCLLQHTPITNFLPHSLESKRHRWAGPCSGVRCCRGEPLSLSLTHLHLFATVFSLTHTFNSLPHSSLSHTHSFQSLSSRAHRRRAVDRAGQGGVRRDRHRPLGRAGRAVRAKRQEVRGAQRQIAAVSPEPPEPRRPPPLRPNR